MLSPGEVVRVVQMVHQRATEMAKHEPEHRKENLFDRWIHAA
jgi:hypothetical protein